MSRLVSSTLMGVVLLVGLSPLPAQMPDADRPTRSDPVKPATRQELDHLEAVKLYGIGAIQERDNRLIEAMHTYEAARRLDPESAILHRTLIPIYFATERVDDALAACKRVLELDANDFQTGYRYARQLRVLGKNKEALAVLLRTAHCPGLKDRLEVRAQVFYDLALLQEEAGDSDEAKKNLLEVLSVLDNPAALMEQGRFNREEIDTQAAETYERLGRLCLKTKQSAKAVEAFHKAMKKDPLRAPRLSYNLSEVFVEQGEPGKALAEVEQYLRSQPQGMDGYELRIKLQQQLGRQTDLLSSLEKSAGADRNNVTLQLLLAREYRKAGRPRNAEPIYHRLLHESPTPEVYRGLFGLYAEDKQQGINRLLARLDEAVSKATDDPSKKKDVRPDGQAEARIETAQHEAAHARAMLIVLRDDAKLVEMLLPAAVQRLSGRSGLNFSTRMMLASLAARTRQLEQAEQLYRSCLAGNRRDNHEFEIYTGLLVVLSLAHKNEAIIAVCEEGLKTTKPTNLVLFYRELAQAHMSLGHVDESLTAADEAVNKAGTRESSLVSRINRAELLSQIEKYDRAIAECQELLKEYNQPGDVHAIRAVLSSIYSAARQHDKAEEQLRMILKDDPNDATANNDLGYLWADQNKNLDEAEKRIRKALELDRRLRESHKSTRVGLDGDRDNAAYIDSLGWLLFRKGDWKGARRELERAVALPSGEDPVVWDHLGDVYFRLKETDKAGRAWKKAIELYESGGRRRPDERYREIKKKLQMSPSRDR